MFVVFFFFSSRRRHTRCSRDWSSDVCSSDLGFLFKGSDAERRYHETGKFEYVNTGGYYHSLPGDPLRTFIDTTAEVQRAMGFQNEKDHPEVAPSQFEINYSYGEVVAAADQIQLYKLICRDRKSTRLNSSHGYISYAVFCLK